MTEERLEYHRSKAIGRTVLYVVGGMLVGAVVGATTWETFQRWSGSLQIGDWLPESRLVYAIITAQIFGLVGLVKALFEGREDEELQRIANHLNLTYVDRPRGEPLRNIGRLFADYEISRVEDAFWVANPRFRLMVAKACYSDEGNPVSAGIVILAMNSSMEFPRCIALQQTGNNGADWFEWIRTLRIKDLYGEKHVIFRNAPDFSREYRVFGQRDAEIRQLLGSELGDFLQRTKTWQLRACSGCLALWDKTAKIDTQRSIERWILDAQTLANCVPEVTSQQQVVALERTSNPQSTTKSKASTEVASSGSPYSSHANRPTKDPLEAEGVDHLVEFFRQSPPRKPAFSVRFQIGAQGLIPRLVGIFFCIAALPFAWLGFQHLLAGGSLGPLLFASVFLLVGVTVHEAFSVSRRRTLNLLKHGIYCEATVLDVVTGDSKLGRFGHVAILKYCVGSEFEQVQLSLNGYEAERLRVALESQDTVPLLHHREKIRQCLIRPQVAPAFGLKR